MFFFTINMKKKTSDILGGFCWDELAIGILNLPVTPNKQELLPIIPVHLDMLCVPHPPLWVPAHPVAFLWYKIKEAQQEKAICSQKDLTNCQVDSPATETLK